jgi:hypothetical protein
MVLLATKREREDEIKRKENRRRIRFKRRKGRGRQGRYEKCYFMTIIPYKLTWINNS